MDQRWHSPECTQGRICGGNRVPGPQRLPSLFGNSMQAQSPVAQPSLWPVGPPREWAQVLAQAPWIGSVPALSGPGSHTAPPLLFHTPTRPSGVTCARACREFPKETRKSLRPRDPVSPADSPGVHSRPGCASADPLVCPATELRVGPGGQRVCFQSPCERRETVVGD